MKDLLLVFLAALAMAALLAPRAASADNATIAAVQRPMLHTFVEIKAAGDNATAAIEAALAEMQRVNDLLNNYDNSSEVALINRRAGMGTVPVSADTFESLTAATRYCELSGGALDITIGPLLRLWGFTKEMPGVPATPDTSELQAARNLVNYRRIILEPGPSGAGQAGLAQKGMWIDVGSFSKGYCADRAIEVLKRHGIRSALVAAGGTICTIGTKPDGMPWKVAVRHPRKDDYLTFVPLVDASISTSGDYERYYRKGGKRRGHIIDPRTGTPVERMQSVSVIAKTGMETDGLDTALFVLGPKEGLQLVEKLPGISALVIDAQGTVSMSRDWPQKVVVY